MARRMLRTGLAAAAPMVLALGAAPAALADDPTQQGAGNAGSTSTEVVVTAQRLDAARAAIQPSIGASTYSLSSQAIQTLPGGDNIELNQVILQMPGVA